MSSRSSHRLALAALAGLVLIWAYSWIVMKQALAYAGPFDFAALRYLGGAAVLFVVLVLRGGPLRPPPLAATIVIGLAQTAGFQGLEQWALVSGGAGRVALLAYTMPFWVVLLAWWLLAERPSRRQWLGLALAAAGLVGVMEPWRGVGTLHSAVLAVAGGVAWALGTVLSKRMFQRHAPDALNFTAWQMLVGALALAAVAVLRPGPPLQWTPAFVGLLAYSAVLASSVAWGLWLFVVRHLPTTTAGLSSLAVPVTSVLLAWAVLSERPSPAETVGLLLIGSGLIVVLRGARRR